jgi:Predicted integral membrane protein (DUF2269)
MDLTPYIGWIVFLHVLGAFLFVAGHGVSMFVAFRVRAEPDRARMAALLDFSGIALGAAYLGLLLLLLGGIVAGLVLGSWSRSWIWVSLALFIVIAVAMTPLGINYFNRLRLALGIRTRNLKPADPDPVPASDVALAEILRARNPELLLAVGGGGFVIILWLMMFKPF